VTVIKFWGAEVLMFLQDIPLLNLN